MHNHGFTYELKKEENGGYFLKIVIQKSAIEDTREKIVAYLAKHLSVRGFRKGSVPPKVALGHLDQKVILEETFKELVSHTYAHILEDEKIRPILDPKVKFMNPPLGLDKDWELEIEGSERPKFKLNSGWQDKVLEINSLQKKEKDVNRQNWVDLIIKALQQNSEIEMAVVLLQADIQNKLADRQAKGLLKNIKSKEEIQALTQELEAEVRLDWLTNLALEQIANEQKIETSREEVESVLIKPGNEKLSPDLVAYLLRQQKTIDYLLGLSKI